MWCLKWTYVGIPHMKKNIMINIESLEKHQGRDPPDKAEFRYEC
jgi:hypothetical protein